MAARQEIVQAYRDLYRQGLRAVQYSAPARVTLRDRLRYVFRASDPAAFDRTRIANTLEFLRGAAATTGLEHKIVKNLLLVWYHENGHWKRRHTRGTPKPELLVLKMGAFDQFYHTLRMLNESMNMCLR
jgi:hypothetical protein